MTDDPKRLETRLRLKRRIIGHLAQRDRWSNRLDFKWLNSPERKWRSLDNPSLKGGHNEDKTRYLITGERGAELRISLRDGQIHVSDESGNEFTILAEGINSSHTSDVEFSRISSFKESGFDNPDEPVLEIPHMGLYVKITKDGRKQVLNDQNGALAQMPAPNIETQNRLQSTRCLHVIPFERNDWDAAFFEVMQRTKLTVSRDLSVEPRLRAINEIDMAKLPAYLAALKRLAREAEKYEYDGPWVDWAKRLDDGEDKKPDWSDLQRSWYDTIEFDGFTVDMPWQFMIEKTDDGFDLVTSLDNRDWILAHGHLLTVAMEADFSAPVEAHQLGPANILSILQDAGTVADHKGDVWHLAVVKTNDPIQHTFIARETMQSRFGLSGYHSAAIHFEQGRMMLAIERQNLHAVSAGYQATMELMGHIRTGLPVSQASRITAELLLKGANLRYADPVAASNGHTLANLMQSYERYAMLTALRDLRGVHDMGHESGPSVTL